MREGLLVQHRSLAEWSMRQKRDLLPAAEIEDGLLVVENMRLGLVHRGANFTEFEQPFELRRADVAHAQSSHLTFPIQILALLPDFIKRDLVRLKLLAEANAT